MFVAEWSVSVVMRNILYSRNNKSSSQVMQPFFPFLFQILHSAAFADAPSALVPGAILVFLMGAIFGYYFLLIGRTCRLTRTATYREVWEETMGNSETLAILVSLVNTTKPALGNLAYSMILADTFRSLFAAVDIEVSRTVALLLITFLGLLPLCLLKNLSVLAPTSMLGVIGFAATTVVMAVRYFDGSYAEGGKYETVRATKLVGVSERQMNSNLSLFDALCFRTWKRSINPSLVQRVLVLLGPILMSWSWFVCSTKPLWLTTTHRDFIPN